MTKDLQEHDREAAEALVRAALARGYAVSVHDGEGLAISRSWSEADTLAQMGHTDEETLLLYSPVGEGGRVLAHAGSVSLVYGNSPGETVSDHTDNEAMRALVEAAGL